MTFTTGKGVEDHLDRIRPASPVDKDSLPKNVQQTFVFAFRWSLNCSIAVLDHAGVPRQYHPEASPGPRDSHYLFQRLPI